MDFRPKTLEELSDRLLDEWKDGNYTFVYNDYDALATGSMMHDIFVEEAKKHFTGEQAKDIYWYAEQIEELVDEANYHLSSKHGDYNSDEPVSDYR